MYYYYHDTQCPWRPKPILTKKIKLVDWTYQLDDYKQDNLDGSNELHPLYDVGSASVAL